MAMTSAETRAQPGGRAVALILRAIETVRVWRRGRRELALLDDRSLRDIAMTRVDALGESRKRFWQR